METCARPTRPGVLCITTTRGTEFIDITDRVQALVACAGVSVGLVNLQTLHTTTALVLNEHEPLLLADFESLLAQMAPRGIPYRHDDHRVRTVNLTSDERLNGHAHCRALLLGATLSLNISDGRVVLGTWQRVFLVELDGPREREISVLVLGRDR
jgi:secondary thiamine-phosphate synthase enzyme